MPSSGTTACRTRHGGDDPARHVAPREHAPRPGGGVDRSGSVERRRSSRRRSRGGGCRGVRGTRKRSFVDHLQGQAVQVPIPYGGVWKGYTVAYGLARRESEWHGSSASRRRTGSPPPTRDSAPRASPACGSKPSRATWAPPRAPSTGTSPTARSSSPP